MRQPSSEFADVRASAARFLRTGDGRRAPALLYACAALVLGACQADEVEPAVANVWDTVAVEGTAEGSADEAAVAPAEPVAVEPEVAEELALPLPPRVEVPPASTSFALDRSGGTLVAGGLSFEVPAGALPDTTTISLEVVADPSELGRPLPGSLPLGAVRGEPWNPQLSRAARLTVPLTHELEPGTPVELLAWQPQMRAFIVAGRARVDETGTKATFPVRQLGEMLVRGVPVRSADAAERCPGEDFTLHQTWPSPSEDAIVGLTAVEERYPRNLAFSLLSDFRLAPSYELVDFKNEEVVNGSAFRADERNHRDEDFLMDPNAAAALAVLAELVASEWLDPFTGEPTTRVRVTEAYDSLIEHSPQSTHYQGRAIDLTTSPVPAADGVSRRDWYGRLSRLSVCAGFDWVLFENQAHVHASVVPTEIAFVADADGALEVSTGELRWPRQVEPTRHRWAVDPEGVAGLRWEAADRFELVTAPVGTVDAAADADDGTHFASTRTVDGLREIVVIDGRAYLTNVGPLPPLGSFDADGTPVDVEYPLPLSPADRYVRSATFRSHPATRDAYERHVLTHAPR